MIINGERLELTQRFQERKSSKSAKRSKKLKKVRKAPGNDSRSRVAAAPVIELFRGKG